MNASILGIGTELTDGQILNRNAQWISQKLKQIGLKTDCHLVVPDEHDAMLSGLQFCADKADLIFITGGLGPTTDDFTREIVAEWSQQDLIFSEPTWQSVVDRLKSRGYEPRDEQKQQCFFPASAKILSNSAGTAAGFLLETKDKFLFVLPGPPAEISAIWTDHIEKWLEQNKGAIDPLVTKIWETLGPGEADVAALTEKTLQGVPVTKGYRVHLPYVEVKATYLLSQSHLVQNDLLRLDEVLRPITITRDSEDLVEKIGTLVKELQVSDVQIIDTSKNSKFWERISPLYRCGLNLSFHSGTPSGTYTLNDGLHFKMETLHECAVDVYCQGHKHSKTFISPYKTDNMAARSQLLLLEHALNFWRTVLEDSTSSL